MENIRDRIRRLRQAHEWTQAELGSVAEMPQGNITAYETGRAVPSLPALRKLAKAFGQSLAEFQADLDLTKSPRPPKIFLYRPENFPIGNIAERGYPSASPPSPAHSPVVDDAGAPLVSTIGDPVSPPPATLVAVDALILGALLDELLASARNNALIVTDLQRMLHAALGGLAPRDARSGDVGPRPDTRHGESDAAVSQEA